MDGVLGRAPALAIAALGITLGVCMPCASASGASSPLRQAPLPRTTQTIPGPFWGTSDPRAYITTASADFTNGMVTLGVDVLQPTNPTVDPNWGLTTGVDWSIQLTPSSAPHPLATYHVEFTGDPATGTLEADVEDAFFDVVCSAVPTFTGQGYTASFSAGCIGNVSTFYWDVTMSYTDESTLMQAVDTAPAAGNSGPVIDTLAPPLISQGYDLVASDGGLFSFGTSAFFGSMGGRHLNAPIVGMADDRFTGGYWMVASDGGVFAFNAPFHGSMGGSVLNAPIVAMTPDVLTGGYWLVASDGGVFAFDAPFYGSMGGARLNEPVVGMAATPNGAGYWLVAQDGGVFAFGDASFDGSMGGSALQAPVVGMAADAFTGGYWIVAADGGVFAFGAPFLGSQGGSALNAPVVGMASTEDTGGYWLVASDGGVFAFGDAQFGGSVADVPLRAPVVGVAVTG